jgi:enterochelin esterase-like enzyme
MRGLILPSLRARLPVIWFLALAGLMLAGCAAAPLAAERTLPRAVAPTETPKPAAPTYTLVPTYTVIPLPTATPAPTAAPHPPAPRTGIVQAGRFRSAALAADVNYLVYLPADYTTDDSRYPVIYLLHGKGGGMPDWLHIRPDLDAMIAQGEIPPVIAVMPDAPFSNRASYYVDSGFGGSPTVPRGEKVESALTRDLVAHIDGAFRTISERDGRAVGGYSMGGWGALRYALAHPDLYRAAIVLSPAVYIPSPPAESSMRSMGAFGRGATLYDETIYTERNYPQTLARTFLPSGLPLAMFIAAGDDDIHYGRPEDQRHDIDLEAHLLYNTLLRVPNMTAELRILQGGHNWDVWRPGFIEGIRYIMQFLGAPQ